MSIAGPVPHPYLASHLALGSSCSGTLATPPAGNTALGPAANHYNLSKLQQMLLGCCNCLLGGAPTLLARFLHQG